MKVIGLVNRIYEGTQPQHIRIYNEDWYWNDYDGYVTKESLKTTPDAQTYLFDRYRIMFALDKEVEIIEEDNNIEKLDKKHFHNKQRQLANKINEIIEELNKRSDK